MMRIGDALESDLFRPIGIDIKGHRAGPVIPRVLQT
jgi:hypothetical protein